MAKNRPLHCWTLVHALGGRSGWQDTHAGEREVKIALRKTLLQFKLHQDNELFERAYGYIREYY